MLKTSFVLAAYAAATASAHVHVGEEGSRTCGTDHDEFDIMASEMVARNTVDRICAQPELQHLRPCLSPEERAALRPVVVPVWYHVIHSGNTGRLTEAQVQAQFEQTNKDFAGGEGPGGHNMDITFSFAGATYTDNAQWFSDGERYESQFKAQLARDNRRNFNQYFTDFRQGLLGFCYFPNSFAESSSMHGCVNLYSSVPGGSSFPYNEGKTTTHETGHGIGLFHTFQGGCNGQGDQVGDTCNQASPTNGCPIGRDSCRDNCADPIHNYMDYSTDACMHQFTRGQDARATAQLSAFRPSLYLGEENVELIKSVLPDAFAQAEEFQRVSQKKYVEKQRKKFGSMYGLE